MFRTRLLRPSDLAWAARLDQAHSPVPWSQPQWLEALTEPGVVCQVVESSSRSRLGVFVYRPTQTGFEVLQLTLRPEAQRQGIGGSLVASLILRLNGPRRHLDVLVPEGSLATLRFWSAWGLRAVALHQGFFQGPQFGEWPQDGVLMRWSRPLEGVPDAEVEVAAVRGEPQLAEWDGPLGR